jgi:RimJ/RimL family protein N-acetyltransferase
VPAPPPEVPGQIRPPSLVGRAYALRPLSAVDYEPLYRMLVTGDNAWRWRFRGATPSPDEFVGLLWANSLVSFVLVDRAGQAVGFSQVYGHDFRSGTAYLGLALDAQYRQRPHVLETAIMLLDYTFATWNLRKLYLEVPEWNLEQLAGGIGRYFVEEGRLREHEYLDGRYWDVVVLALYRDAWAKRPWATAERFLGLVAAGDNGDAGRS